jgi:hypothetical protein
MLSLALPASASVESPTSKQEYVSLKPYGVEGSYTKAVLKIHFRYPMIWNGVKTLTFTVVPNGWAKAGVKVGDHVVGIDGRLIDGLSIRDFTRLLKKAGAEPSTVFDVQSDASEVTRKVEIRIKKGEEGSFTIAS